MANISKRSNGRAWKNERAAVKTKNGSRSNKYRPSADKSERPEAGNSKRYWRAGYTRKDGVHVKGHYVTNPHHK